MPVETLTTSSWDVTHALTRAGHGSRPAIRSGTGTTALPPVSIPLYRRPDGHPLGGVLRQKQNCSKNRVAHFGRSSRNVLGSPSTACPGARHCLGEGGRP